MIHVGILGSTGRMGQAILEALEAHPRCTLGRAGIRENTDDVFEKSHVIIDFTTALALPNHLEQSLRHQKPLVIGTTGIEHHHPLLASTATKIPLVVSPNMSIGITLLTNLIQKTANLLDESYDIEISELHHRYKKDSPSGTALLWGQAAALGRHKQLDQVRCDSSRQGERQTGTIGFAIKRGGTVIGDHSAQFIGDDEMIELSHRGLSRTLYAKGALRAAEWVATQKPGLYSMADVLGL